MPTVLSPGDRCGGHEILSHLATTPSSQIYVAQTPTGELRALKIMTAPGTAPPRARFAQEGEALGLIVHPNVVRVYGAGEKSGTLTISDPVFAAFKVEVVAFDTACTKAADKSSANMADRKTRYFKVQQQLGHFVDRVQGLADAMPTPVEAVGLITTVGLSVRQVNRTSKPELAARYTGMSGEMLVDARAVKGAACYYWEHSVDQQTWVASPETPSGRTKITGLTPGQLVFFRFRTLSRDGKSDYSTVISMIAH